MRQMLLSSSSSSLTSKILKKFFNKIKDLKVLVIICPENKIQEVKYKRKTKKILKRLGIYNVQIVNIRKNIKAKNYEDCDIFWSSGGNTFLILDRIRKTGFDKYIKNHVSKGKLYLGFSAGSIIVFKTIEIAGWGTSGDENKIKLKNLKGLNLFEIALFPHYENKLKNELKNFKKKVKYKVKEIRDGEAIFVKGRSWKLVK